MSPEERVDVVPVSLVIFELFGDRVLSALFLWLFLSYWVLLGMGT